MHATTNIQQALMMHNFHKSNIELRFLKISHIEKVESDLVTHFVCAQSTGTLSESHSQTYQIYH